MRNRNIDMGRTFDWGRTSEGYGKYRDIYPDAMYQRLRELGIGLPGQRILDIGTGTGVLPRAMYKSGAKLTGVDISPQQISQARRLAQDRNMDIAFSVSPVESLPFQDEAFQAATAAQCFEYFDQRKAAEEVSRVLVPGGLFAVIYMGWLPYEDDICRHSEELILKYNPAWTGGGGTRGNTPIPEAYLDHFRVAGRELFDVHIPFTRSSWNGRIVASRGVSATLSQHETEAFSQEHTAMLEQTAPEAFTVLHYVSIVILEKTD